MIKDRGDLNRSTLSGDLGHKYDQIPPTVLGKLYEEAQIAGMSLDDYLKAKKNDPKSRESFWKNPPDIVIEGSG